MYELTVKLSVIPLLVVNLICSKLIESIIGDF